MNQVPLRHVIQAYIGGGWGKEAYDQDHTVPASVIRGTDLDAVQSGVIGGVPYRWHKASNARSRILCAGDIVFEVSGGSKDQPVGRSLLLDDARLAQISGVGNPRIVLQKNHSEPRDYSSPVPACTPPVSMGGSQNRSVAGAVDGHQQFQLRGVS